MVPADTQRLNVDLGLDSYAALREATVEDGHSISDRVRALVELWREDAALAAAANERAGRIAAERRRSRANR